MVNGYKNRCPHRTDEPLGGELREKPQEKTEQIQPTCCRLKTRQSLWSQMDSSTFLCGNWCSRRITRFGVGAHVWPAGNYWLGTETVDARCSRHGDLLQPLHVSSSLPQTMGTTGTDGPMERGQWSRGRMTHYRFQIVTVYLYCSSN